MYNFINVNEVSEGVVLPSEALQINGEYIENIIPGYRTLHVSGREALSRELTTFETGTSDGETMKSTRYPSRVITVTYQLVAASNEAFRDAFNKLASILNTEEAELIFRDEPDKFFKGTPGEIGGIEPGLNSVVGTFELFCADPFKYSVIEHEAEPELTENTFLIDYQGTYKAFPTLEAEFFGENESISSELGLGDCGYVAFFNENEKIIQLGDPEETETETYEKSQTLVNQQFKSETAWNNITQANWASNVSGIPASGISLVGSVGMLPAAYSVTTAPITSGTLLTATSKAATPNIKYTVTAQASGRTEKSVNVKISIVAALVGSSSGTTSIKAGAKVTLNKTSLYSSATASSSSSTKTGTYYLWDASVVSGRIRITNASSNVGKSGRVTGWVNVSAINLSSAGGGSLGSGYGLKGSIQLNGGDWHTVTIKSESASWSGTSGHTVTLTATVKNLEASTTLIEDIKFKVERTDDKSGSVGILDDTMCRDLEISAYTAPVVGAWYLSADSYGIATGWHGPSITRTIPADLGGDTGAKNFTFSYSQKMSIGYGSSATQEVGSFMALLTSGSGTNRKIVAGVDIYKSTLGKTATVRFYVNGKLAEQMNDVDLSVNNKYWGNDNYEKNIITVRTSTIKKSGEKFEFNIGGIKKTFNDSSATDVTPTEITFYWGQYGTYSPLSYNGLYWAKFVKDNCDTWKDIPNKFSANDIVTADCKSGEVYLNNTLTPSLGALGNDWEDFYLKPGINQIGFSYSNWVASSYAPKFKIRYREVFI